ncbi:alpha/beta hydrolase [Aeromicrobium wangtongii]|uniref:Alpha/beta hydrolase n=1 Tax=Aeromicrobium wangtongii TaxID=2969247 RepID=A0ABY5MD46_9ACTN|nr:alpha/beta hydrolase [Aeromicrobium wangtongii]MCD9197914.1 alpha/beta hydrolase [Aeromicrobium wangtongii]UUP15392.1 alpha/beta hydrolase [Aeromicrobium wangtongii]
MGKKGVCQMTDFTQESDIPRPPFDADCESALEALSLWFPQPLTLESLALMRRQIGDWTSTDAELERGGAYRVDELVAPSWHGGPDMGVTVCMPTVRTGPVPVLYNIHGGGMVMGDRRTGLGVTLDFAAPAGLAVVSIEYRLAPEHPHPIPVEDCYAGLEWLVAHADQLGVDPDRIILYGSSAGGGLAAGVALMSRDRGGPRLLGQVLSCPMLDHRNDSSSSQQFARHGTWTRASNEMAWTALLGEGHRDVEASIYASPSRAADLGGLPPAFIDAGSAEVFRDEATAFASRIWAAGGSAELHIWAGGFHGFDADVPNAPISLDAVDARNAWIRRLLQAG